MKDWEFMECLGVHSAYIGNLDDELKLWKSAAATMDAHKRKYRYRDRRVEVLIGGEWCIISTNTLFDNVGVELSVEEKDADRLIGLIKSGKVRFVSQTEIRRGFSDG